MSDPVPICDSEGSPLASGKSYKIRLPGGFELCCYAESMDSYWYLALGPPGSGVIWHIDGDSWLSGNLNQLRPTVTAPDGSTPTLYTQLWDDGIHLGTEPGFSMYGVAGNFNNTFLGADLPQNPGSDYLIVGPAIGSTGLFYIYGDTTGSYLDCTFVRMP